MEEHDSYVITFFLQSCSASSTPLTTAFATHSSLVSAFIAPVQLLVYWPQPFTWQDDLIIIIIIVCCVYKQYGMLLWSI